jgi:hypothetical protein
MKYDAYGHLTTRSARQPRTATRRERARVTRTSARIPPPRVKLTAV